MYLPLKRNSDVLQNTISPMTVVEGLMAILRIYKEFNDVQRILFINMCLLAILELFASEFAIVRMPLDKPGIVNLEFS